jgi:hypothetical protein
MWWSGERVGNSQSAEFSWVFISQEHGVWSRWSIGLHVTKLCVQPVDNSTANLNYLPHCRKSSHRDWNGESFCGLYNKLCSNAGIITLATLLSSESLPCIAWSLRATAFILSFWIRINGIIKSSVSPYGQVVCCRKSCRLHEMTNKFFYMP